MARTKSRLVRTCWILIILVSRVSFHEDEYGASVAPVDYNETIYALKFIIKNTIIMRSVIFANLFYIFYVINSVENCQWTFILVLNNS